MSDAQHGIGRHSQTEQEPIGSGLRVDRDGRVELLVQKVEHHRRQEEPYVASGSAPFDGCEGRRCEEPEEDDQHVDQTADLDVASRGSWIQPMSLDASTGRTSRGSSDSVRAPFSSNSTVSISAMNDRLSTFVTRPTSITPPRSGRVEPQTNSPT